MDFGIITIIVAALALIIALVDLFIILSLRRETEEISSMIQEKEKTAMLNHMLIPFENVGTGSQESIEEGVRSIARIMKDSLVTKYGIKNAATVKELVEEIKDLNIDSKLKEELLDFFDHIAYTIYSDDVSADSVKGIKNQALDIISKLNLRVEETSTKKKKKRKK